PGPGWTYGEFLEAARRLTADTDGDGHVDRYGYYGQLPPSLFDAGFISEDGTRATCDSPAMVRCLQANLALVGEHRVAPSIQQQVQGALDRLAMFRTGQVAMLQAFTWDLPQLRAQMTAAWGIALNPEVERRATWASSQAVLISARTDHPEEAWALARAFLAPAFQARMTRRGMPSDLELARRLAASGDPAYAHLPVLLTAVDELCATPRVAHLAEAQQIFDQACESVWTGRATPQAAMRRAAQLIDRMIQQHRRYGS
ncbi:MAG TPA: extracellular solute-binding protein, partial [Bacillota bacterium]